MWSKTNKLIFLVKIMTNQQQLLQKIKNKQRNIKSNFLNLPVSEIAFL